MLGPPDLSPLGDPFGATQGANSSAWVMTMRDSQVIDGTAFYDRIAFNDL